MKNRAQSTAMDEAVESRDGSTQETSIMHELSKVAKADIIWKVSWSLEGSSVKNM